jgi:formylglycine-generating enzyme required for sulfatase activity
MLGKGGVLQSGDFVSEVRKAIDLLKPGGWLWVYFAGHGEAVSGDGQPGWLFSDYSGAMGATAGRLAVGDDVVRLLADFLPSVVVIVADACYTRQPRSGAYNLGRRGFNLVYWSASAGAAFEAHLHASNRPRGVFTHLLVKAFLGAVKGRSGGIPSFGEVNTWLAEAYEALAAKTGTEVTRPLLNEQRSESVAPVSNCGTPWMPPESPSDPGDVVRDFEPRRDPGTIRTLEWVPIRGQDSFEMGCSPGDTLCLDAEKPRHTVDWSRDADGSLLRLQVLAHEVTQAEFACLHSRLADASECPRPVGDCTRRADETFDAEAGFPFPSLPQTGVNWHCAGAICAAAGGRLCTEAEWEFAARCGQAGKFTGGGESLDPAFVPLRQQVAGATIRNRALPVVFQEEGGQPWCGLWTMTGNPSEWVQDCWHRSYRIGDGMAPMPLEVSKAWESECEDPNVRVVRGGNMKALEVDAPVNFRVSRRLSFEADRSEATVGIRCCRQ